MSEFIGGMLVLAFMFAVLMAGGMAVGLGLRLAGVA
jgi:hypothetical protein